jgi:hypothetical protein
MIERQIITGLIVSTDFQRSIKDRWNVRLFESGAATRIASWCKEYFDKYGKDIEGIFQEKMRNAKRMSEEVVTDIEEILEGLSEEYETQTDFNVDYLVERAVKYFNERHLSIHSEEIKALLGQDKLLEAEKLASSFKPLAKDSGSWIDLSDVKVLDRIEKAFNQSNECLIEYPFELGEFWNAQLIREGFVAFMASEKRGKTFMLLDLAMRACRQKRRVAFFQAGDMTEGQQIKRISTYLTKRSYSERYSGLMYEPIKDCVLNQNDECNKDEREGSFGVFTKKNEKEIRKDITMSDLITTFKDNQEYVPCTACEEFKKSHWGCPWLKEVDTGKPLSAKGAKEAYQDFFINFNRQFKLSSHPSGTLTVKQAQTIMDIWESQDGFTPDVIIFDYADIMDDEVIKEFRHKQNKIWMDMRGLSQSRKALVITVTQTDADSYTKDTLGMENFSEDKRKYAHVTAMYGLNQDKHGREKGIGIMRINEIVVRESDFNIKNQIHVLQNLRRGRPVLESYW